MAIGNGGEFDGHIAEAAGREKAGRTNCEAGAPRARECCARGGLPNPGNTNAVSSMMHGRTSQ
jgi:hypothetical protein